MTLTPTTLMQAFQDTWSRSTKATWPAHAARTLDRLLPGRKPALLFAPKDPGALVRSTFTAATTAVAAQAFRAERTALASLGAAACAWAPTPQPARLKNLGELELPHLWPLFQLLQLRTPLRLFLVAGAARDVLEDQSKLLLGNHWHTLAPDDRFALIAMPISDPTQARARLWTVTPGGLRFDGEALWK